MQLPEAAMLVRTSMLESTLNIKQFYENTTALLKPIYLA